MKHDDVREILISIESRPSFETERFLRLTREFDKELGKYEYAIHKGYGEYVPISEQDATEIVAAVKTISLPSLMPESPAGFDGATTELRIEYGGIKLALQWWQDGPEEWQGLQQIVSILGLYAKT